MKPLLIVKNSHEGPGSLEILLKEKALPYKIVNLDEGELFPHPEDYSGVVVLGGPDSANDETQKMLTEIQRNQEILALGLPYLGICLGLQSLVKAAGGKVIKNPIREVAFRDAEGKPFTIELTDEGKKDVLFEGLITPLQVFHLHGETVELTDEMHLLGEGKWCKNQVVKIGDKAYGLQCHFELTEEMFEEWKNKDPWLKELDSKTLENDWREVKETYLANGEILFENFIDKIVWPAAK